jgi:O-antigen ligase
VSAIGAIARRGDTQARAGSLMALGAMVALIGAGMAVALYKFPPSLGMILVVGIGMLGLLALAVANYEAGVTLGFVVFGIVAMEPAPPDGVFAVVIAVALVTGRFNLARVPMSVFSLLGAFVFLNILSSIEVIEVQDGIRFMTITVYLAVFAIWFTSYLDSRERARAVVLAYLIPATIFAFLASAALFGPVPGRNTLLAYDGTRSTGLFEDPNVFGPFLVPAALIVLQEILDPRLLNLRMSVKLLTFLVLTCGVLFSYSRAAWVNEVVGAAVLLGVLMMRRGGGRRAIAVVALVIITTIGVAGTLALTGSLGFLQERAKVQTYDTQRFGAQRTGIALAEHYPVGVGPGQFELRVPISAHSAYVRTLAEQGMLGLVLIAALFLTTLVFAGNNAVSGRDTYGIGSAALLGAWVGLLVNSFVVDTLHWRHLWFVAALIWVGAMRPLSELPAPQRGPAAL